MARYCVGDSNARSLSLCVDKVHEFGGHTMHIVGQFGIHADLRVSPDDHVLFCFGEVDVRVHIVQLARQSGVPVDLMCTQVVSRYVERIRTFCVERQVHGYVIAAPPQAVPTTPDAVVPTVDSILERVARTEYVNRELAQICAPDIIVIDPWQPFRNADGSLNMDMSDGIVHCASSFNEKIRDLVVPHFSRTT